MTSKPTSIKDLAALTGFSVATISRVINDNGRFSEDTRAKVLAAIESTGYKSNKLASGLRSKKSNMIGLIVPDITGEFYSNVVKTCEQTLAQYGYSSIICNTDRSEKKEQEYLVALSEHMVEAMIIISNNNSDAEKDLTTLPTVFIDREPYNTNQISVASDHYDGAKTATEFLINHGFSPYIITSKTNSSSTALRMKAFQDTLKAHKIKPSNRIFRSTKTSNIFLTADNEVTEFLQQIPDKKFGIFAINDNVAFMVTEAAKKLGISIPNNCSIIGFDDTSLTKISSPKISTIHQNITEISKIACQKLVNQLNNIPQSTNLSEIVPVQLIERETTN
jgi:LacI family transcriptional regulator